MSTENFIVLMTNDSVRNRLKEHRVLVCGFGGENFHHLHFSKQHLNGIVEA